jgi:hypothetical protein
MPKPWERCTIEEKVESLHERLARLEGAVNGLVLYREAATMEIGDLRQQIERIEKQLAAK